MTQPSTTENSELFGIVFYSKQFNLQKNVFREEIFIPTPIIFDTSFPAGMIHTWMQLAALLQNRNAPLTISLHELSLVTGKSRRTLSRHLAKLDASSLLSCKSDGHGKLIITFPEQELNRPIHLPVRCISAFREKYQPQIPETPEYNAYFPDRILGYLSFSDEGE